MLSQLSDVVSVILDGSDVIIDREMCFSKDWTRELLSVCHPSFVQCGRPLNVIIPRLPFVMYGFIRCEKVHDPPRNFFLLISLTKI